MSTIPKYRVRPAFLPFALPDTDDDEIKEIAEAVRSGWVTTGPKTRQFEANFATQVGAKCAVAVNSCTAAMHLALEAAGIQAGDSVITTPYTFAASAEVVRYFNATPVFVDVEPDTLNIDPSLLKQVIVNEQAQGRKVKAIVPVHIGGLSADLDAVYAIAAQYDLAVIEDAAHAFPAKYKGRMIGSPLAVGSEKLKVKSNGETPGAGFPHAVCFSFYATKTITTGEGGMICTDDEELAARCRTMALHGISRDPWKRYTSEGSWQYEIVAPGFKYNMTDIAAGMGLAQLRKADRMWRRRCEIAQRYNEAFGSMPELLLPADRADCQHAWHLYVLRLNLDRLRISRSEFIEALKGRNIGTSVHFIPLHIHPYYQETYGYSPSDFPVAYREYGRVISLPIYSKMTDEDVDDVIEAVQAIAMEHRN